MLTNNSKKRQYLSVGILVAVLALGISYFGLSRTNSKISADTEVMGSTEIKPVYLGTEGLVGSSAVPVNNLNPASFEPADLFPQVNIDFTKIELAKKTSFGKCGVNAVASINDTGTEDKFNGSGSPTIKLNTDAVNKLNCGIKTFWLGMRASDENGTLIALDKAELQVTIKKAPSGPTYTKTFNPRNLDNTYKLQSTLPYVNWQYFPFYDVWPPQSHANPLSDVISLSVSPYQSGITNQGTSIKAYAGNYKEWFGIRSFWAYDISSLANDEIVLDAKINANFATISDSAYPSGDGRFIALASDKLDSDKYPSTISDSGIDIYTALGAGPAPITPTGYWEAGKAKLKKGSIIDSGDKDTLWAQISWVGDTPTGTSVDGRIIVCDDVNKFDTINPILDFTIPKGCVVSETVKDAGALPIGNNITKKNTDFNFPPNVFNKLDKIVTGRYAQVYMTLKTNDVVNSTPKIYSVSLIHFPNKKINYSMPIPPPITIKAEDTYKYKVDDRLLLTDGMAADIMNLHGKLNREGFDFYLRGAKREPAGVDADNDGIKGGIYHKPKFDGNGDPILDGDGHIIPDKTPENPEGIEEDTAQQFMRSKMLFDTNKCWAVAVQKALPMWYMATNSPVYKANEQYFNSLAVQQLGTQGTYGLYSNSQTFIDVARGLRLTVIPQAYIERINGEGVSTYDKIDGFEGGEITIRLALSSRLTTKLTAGFIPFKQIYTGLQNGGANMQINEYDIKTLGLGIDYAIPISNYADGQSRTKLSLGYENGKTTFNSKSIGNLDPTQDYNRTSGVFNNNTLKVGLNLNW